MKRVNALVTGVGNDIVIHVFKGLRFRQLYTMLV
jgi:hypothetical protein